MKAYSQLKAMLSITRASLIGIFRSPSAVLFGLAFPFIFIIVFGFIGGGSLSIDVAVRPGCDTTGIYQGLEHITALNFVTGKSDSEINTELKKGSLDAAVLIASAPKPAIDISTSASSKEQGVIFKSMVNEVLLQGIQARMNIDPNAFSQMPVIKQTEISGREYKRIDFILPGQIGFSLLGTGIFGTAFLFFTLRETLVVKRFFATPIKRGYIVLGEALSRLCFGLLTSLVIITVGHFAFGFTLVHGLLTFIEMMILSALGLMVFMGFGFVVSGVAKSLSTIPVMANLLTLPQFLLAGTFFSITNFPKWLQVFSNILPLTYLNHAMRKVAFDGYSLLNPDVLKDEGVMLIWGVVVYLIAIKVFKWE